MPTFMPRDTREVLGSNAEKCDSRSLLFDRLVYYNSEAPEARKLHFAQFCPDSFGFIREIRREWQTELPDQKNKKGKKIDDEGKKEEKIKLDELLRDTEGLAKRTAVVGPTLTEINHRKISPKVAAYEQFVSKLPKCAVIYAQLQSRLMVNMAGGVMENAGLCIDRFGLPYIPGSAVKGCARRTALAALREWCEAGGQLENKPKADENPLTPCCENFGSPADMLAAIARVFGWCELDWADSSDLRWACNDQDHILAEAAVSIANHFHWPIKREHEAQPWRSLPNFGGSVSFLPAYPTDLGKTGKIDGLPLEVPPLGKLELDVVTCHHRQYYEGKLPTATDTEEPVPVVFPAVAPGHVFTFALAPLRGSDAQLLELASVWLKTGLQTFGLGAKTNAGYGWFVDVTPAAQPLIAAEQERLAQEAAKKAEQARLAAEAAAKAAAEAERLAKAPPHERFCAEYAKLADEPFATQAKKFAEMNDEQRHGFVLALKQRRDTAKRWAKKKPELLKPWQEFAQKLQPPIQLP